jgi:opacity protein-like surface antigen
LIFGASDSVAPFGTSAFTKSHDDSVGILGTIGAGLYIAPGFRADITVDFRRQRDARISGSYNYTQYALVPGPATPTGLIVEDSSSDTTRYQGTVAMINGYWDLSTHGAFTPYIGAGIGLVFDEIDRSQEASEFTVDPTTSPAVPTALRSFGATNHDSSVGFAAALMAGLGYSLGPRAVLDFNYRLQYLQGFDTSMWIAAPQGPTSMATSYSSRVSVGDLWEHQIRAGIRWNLW